jgi:hypothetical protein
VKHSLINIATKENQMADLEDCRKDTKEIEQSMMYKDIVLGIDWGNDEQVRALAREALEHSAEVTKFSPASPVDYELLAKVELFGCAVFMLKNMEESTLEGTDFESRAGGAWKAFAKALLAEAALSKSRQTSANNRLKLAL